MTGYQTKQLMQSIWPGLDRAVFGSGNPAVAPKLLQRVRDEFSSTYEVPRQVYRRLTAAPTRAYLLRERSNSTALQKTYRLHWPLISWDNDPAEYVVVSAASVMYSGPETYVFKSDAEGEVLNWGELGGSFQGDLDHERALAEAGYVEVE